jgi:hypothetical protein
MRIPRHRLRLTRCQRYLDPERPSERRGSLTRNMQKARCRQCKESSAKTIAGGGLRLNSQDSAAAIHMDLGSCNQQRAEAVAHGDILSSRVWEGGGNVAGRFWGEERSSADPRLKPGGKAG